jgi:hypothetical protein
MEVIVINASKIFISAEEIYGQQWIKPPAGYRFTESLELLKDGQMFLGTDFKVKYYTVGEKDAKLVRLALERDPIQWVVWSPWPQRPCLASYYVRDGKIWKVLEDSVQVSGKYIIVQPAAGSREPVLNMDYFV